MQKTQPLVRTAPPEVVAGPPLNIVGALLLACLLTALVAIGSGLAARVYPTWRPGYLTAACFLVAVEAALVRYRMRLGRHFELGALRYLAAELFALVVLMRIVALFGAGPTDLAARIEEWVRSPLSSIDGVFMICLAVGALVALLARRGMRELEVLEPRTTARPPETGIAADTLRAAEEGREGQALGYIASRLGWGAVLALLALTAQMVDLSRLGAPGLVLSPAAALAGVVYLICGVLLYSQARLGLLRARWQRDETTVAPAVLRRWRLSSPALVLLVALVGLLLPRSYGDGVVDVVRAVLLALLSIASLIALFFGAVAIGALGLALAIPALILALLSGGFERSTYQPPMLPPLPPPAQEIPRGEPPVAPGVVFWTCVAILAGYAFWTVLRRQEWAVAAAARLRAGILAPLLAWLSGVWAGASSYARAVGEAVAQRLRPPPRRRPAARPRLRQLGPGGLVRYFYAATLERAARSGIWRRRAETPYEYGEKLRANLPEAAEDVDRLTEAYLAAVYAPRPTTPAEAAEARGAWQRLRRALRGRKGA